MKAELDRREAILLLRQFLTWGRALQRHAQEELDQVPTEETGQLFHNTQKFLDQFPCRQEEARGGI